MEQDLIRCDYFLLGVVSSDVSWAHWSLLKFFKYVLSLATLNTIERIGSEFHYYCDVLRVARDGFETSYWHSALYLKDSNSIYKIDNIEIAARM